MYSKMYIKYLRERYSTDEDSIKHIKRDLKKSKIYINFGLTISVVFFILFIISLFANPNPLVDSLRRFFFYKYNIILYVIFHYWKKI